MVVCDLGHRVCDPRPGFGWMREPVVDTTGGLVTSRVTALLSSLTPFVVTVRHFTAIQNSAGSWGKTCPPRSSRSPREHPARLALCTRAEAFRLSSRVLFRKPEPFPGATARSRHRRWDVQEATAHDTFLAKGWLK